MIENRNHHRPKPERGFALLLTLFALLLLSAIAISMIFAANIETGISGNYREKQQASYAAASALQEVRDRLRPGGDLDPACTSNCGSNNLKAVSATALSGLPALGTPNIVYVINPANGESVKPWDYTNQYADTELCHEHILGLSGTSGVPCTGSSSLPSGNNWYVVVDNSSITNYAYKMNPPLSYKWIRIQLKTDNATPWYVDKDATTATSTPVQVCWDGKNQNRMTGATDTSCVQKGQVTAVTLTNPGSGYTSAPTVTLNTAPSDSGSGATAHAIMKTVSGGQVAKIDLTSDGHKYTSAPTVVITPAPGDPGLGAAAVANISTSPLASVSLASKGTGCYATAPAVNIGGPGTNAKATSTLETTSYCVYGVKTVTGTCKSQKNKTTTDMVLSGGAGTGAKASITWDKSGNPGVPVITANGTGYSSQPTTITGSGCTVTIPANGWIAGYRVNSLQLTDGGSGYDSVPTVTFGSGTTQGTGTATIDPTGGKVNSVTLTSGGSGYLVPPTVSFVGGGSEAYGATAVATLGAGQQVIDSIVVDNGGTGYGATPTVTLTGGGGAGATATATIIPKGSSGKVYLLTAMGAVPRMVNGVPSPTKTLMQMEAAYDLQTMGFFTGALTIDGPNPTVSMPNSNPFVISGVDANSCGQTAYKAHPAIGAYDNSSKDIIKTAVPTGRAGNYVGTPGYPNPDVENISAVLGEEGKDPKALDAMAEAIGAYAASQGTKYGPYSGEKPISSFTIPDSVDAVTYVDGDLTLSGNATGHGVLVVTGALNFSGNYSWYGAIYVIGQGSYNANGGGNGEIHGSLFVAKTRATGGSGSGDSTSAELSQLGTPIANFAGGGGNGIRYDHCLSDNLMAKIPKGQYTPSGPLKVLSVHTIPY